MAYLATMSLLLATFLSTKAQTTCCHLHHQLGHVSAYTVVPFSADFVPELHRILNHSARLVFKKKEIQT